MTARMTSSSGVKIRDIVSEIRSNFSVRITMSRAWKAKQISKALIEGDAVKQCNLLWRYSVELRRVNSGNTCKINLTRVGPTIQPRFSNFYFYLDGLKKGLTTSCRPFIGVDGCYLKTKYGRTLLIAVGRDPNDQYYPIVFGVYETETNESWRRFLTLLLEDIGQEKMNSFIVDTSKKTCTCNFWELVGIPYRHAVAALGFRNQSPEDFVDDYYSKDTYEKCYGHNRKPKKTTSGQEQTQTATQEQTQPTEAQTAT
ncbi:hypothetical protein KIW84_011467 [Lathyrus oleraceus]|uniref:SWIM-type domain-containing protein n=2 Tax=Pisum sativum TaxID=3888 RepID=A0A9D5BEZ7_PEA|nr:hypothetical protein KIW84_011467 [Pisum sativum]